VNCNRRGEECVLNCELEGEDCNFEPKMAWGNSDPKILHYVSKPIPQIWVLFGEKKHFSSTLQQHILEDVLEQRDLADEFTMWQKSYCISTIERYYNAITSPNTNPITLHSSTKYSINNYVKEIKRTEGEENITREITKIICGIRRLCLEYLLRDRLQLEGDKWPFLYSPTADVLQTKYGNFASIADTICESYLRIDLPQTWLEKTILDIFISGVKLGTFRWKIHPMTYSDLWDEWQRRHSRARLDHVSNSSGSSLLLDL
jgi:hypothetical protein